MSRVRDVNTPWDVAVIPSEDGEHDTYEVYRYVYRQGKIKRIAWTEYDTWAKAAEMAHEMNRIGRYYGKKND